jgi:hypothetical protein
MGFIFFRSLAIANSTPPIKFIENKKQWPANIHFSARVPGGNMMIQAGKFQYYFLDEQRLEELHEQSHHSYNESDGNLPLDEMIYGHAVEVNFIGANPESLPLAFGKSAEYYNYFLGNDAGRWASKAFAYDGFTYPSLYKDVSLKVYSVGQNIKYDFVVAPYGDASKILLEYSGAESLTLNNGRLEVRTPIAEIFEQRPIAYQWIDGRKVLVSCEYYLDGNQLSFCFPQGYDPCYELIIDPLLIFSTYSGSSADNWGSTATPGEQGNLYSAGVTSHNNGGNFPASPGAFQTAYGGLYDIAILKYDSAGQQLLYASYLGGNNSESPHSLVMNSKEELIVLGTTSSFNFPTSVNALDRNFNGGTAVTHVVPYNNGSDIFVARISKDGSQLLSSTFLGGSLNDGLNPSFGALTKNYGDELRGDIITDADGSIYISSVTASQNFPATKGYDITYNGGDTDAILVKLKPDLSSIIWSTFLGGGGTDASHTLKLDKDNGIFLAGGTTSTNFPVKSNAYQTLQKGDADGWIAHIGKQGDTIIHATYTGTSSFDQIYFLDINEAEEVYVYGQTNGNFPVTPGVYNNPNSGQFIQKFNTSLSTLIFSTVFGSRRGIPDISPTAFLVNECNNIYMSGWGGLINGLSPNHWNSNTRSMPVSGDAFQQTTSGSDFYFLVLTDDATEFLYGTYLGGRQSATHVDGGTSRFDKGGIVYHAVCSGCTSSNTAGESTSDFPTTAGAWSRTNGSTNCNNAAFKFDLSSLKARIQSNSVKLNMPGLNKVCIPDSIVFENFSTGGEIFEWDLGDGTRIVKTDKSLIQHQYKSTGRYVVSLKAIDPGTCKVEDSAFLIVDIFIAQGKVQGDDALCLGSPYQLKASGAVQYSWTSEDGSFQSNEATPIVRPTDTLRYFVTLNEASGCIRRDTVELTVIPLIEPDFEIDRGAECFDRPKITVKNLTDSLRDGDRLFFDFGDGQTSDAEEGEHDFNKDGLYSVKLVGVRDICITEKIIPMPVFKLVIPNVITPKVKDDANDTFTIQLGDENGLTPGYFGFKTSLIIYNRWGEKVYEAADYQYDWDGEGLASGVYFYEVSVDGHATCKSWLHLVK